MSTERCADTFEHPVRAPALFARAQVLQVGQLSQNFRISLSRWMVITGSLRAGFAPSVSLGSMLKVTTSFVDQNDFPSFHESFQCIVAPRDTKGKDPVNISLGHSHGWR